MALNKIYQHVFMAGSLLLIALGFIFPQFTQTFWFDIIVKIREAINTGDSGHLILASASVSFLLMIESTLLFLEIMFIIHIFKLRQRIKREYIIIISTIFIFFLHWVNSRIFNLPWEPVTTLLALLVSVFLFEIIFRETNSFLHVSVVTTQVFFAFQWLNIMPSFSVYQMGQSDIPYSIKIAGIYLQASSVLNFAGFAFFIPFVFSSFVTATLFISSSQNIRIMKENHRKEQEIKDIKVKILENRIYREVNSLVHDLKTPLVTIRGLNSLLTSSMSLEKLEEYSSRIESSVSKMSEMISSFLYESSKQNLKTEDLINYIRAQIPLEDDTIKVEMDIDENLPQVFVNKVRVARALVNILENSILAPCNHPYKHIKIEAGSVGNGVRIAISDNGIGIKEEDLPKIWEIGFSTNNTSGLGLPFAKQIIEDNNGTIEVSSKVEHGTRTVVFLPSP